MKHAIKRSCSGRPRSNPEVMFPGFEHRWQNNERKSYRKNAQKNNGDYDWENDVALD